MITVTKKDLIELGYGTSFAADIIRESKKLMIAKARSLICTFLQQIHLRNFHFSQLHNLKNFNYFHIGFLYQIQSATSHPAFDHRGLSIDTPSISYL